MLLLQKPRLRKLSVLHFSFELDNDGIITFQLHTFVEKIQKKHLEYGKDGKDTQIA